MKQKELKKLESKGITLIALVITIIVLLILAGVSIAMLTGENGILTQAQEAKKQTSIAEEKEQIALAYNAAVAKKQSTDITAQELDDELKANEAGAEATPDGENIKVTFTESQREYIIDKNGNITEGGSGTVTPPTPDEPEASVPGKTYEEDTEVTVGDETVVIPGGATISKIPGEYGDDEEGNIDVDNGLVIYITNDEEITDEDWQDAETMQKTYDQFVWVPVKEALAVDMNGNSTIDKTDIDLMVEAGRYPMAIKTSDEPETYKGLLYDFEEEGGAVKVTARDYTTTSDNREPAFLTDTSFADGSSYNNVGITESSLQAEYNGMIKVVEEAGGFWVGRYETSKMSTDIAKDTSTTDFIQVIKGTTEGINNVNWYRMYAQQKNYEKHLSKSNVKSSMIWGSQWDQIMIWMKEKENTTKGGFYVTNSVGMGNYGNISGVDDGYDDTNNPSATGCFDVKNIYDLAGNVYDWTLEANDTNDRVVRRRQLQQCP